MELSQAIEILAAYRDGVKMEELREYPIVLSLSIEALKKIDELHVNNVLGDHELLPGETRQ